MNTKPHYAWFMRKAEKSKGICLCGCTGWWRAHWELAIFLLFNKDLTDGEDSAN